MTSSRIFAAMLLASALAIPAGAQNITDLEPVEIIVDQLGGDPPVQGSPVRIRVRVTNHGPDAYDGTTLGKARTYRRLQGGRLSITIDIDEPSKPQPDMPIAAGIPTFTLTDSFAVNIAVNDTTELDFGLTSFVPDRHGLHGISATTAPGFGNQDLNPSNDVFHGSFVALPITPTVGWLALAVLATTVTLVTRRRLTRKRLSAGATRM